MPEKTMDFHKDENNRQKFWEPEAVKGEKAWEQRGNVATFVAVGGIQVNRMISVIEKKQLKTGNVLTYFI